MLRFIASFLGSVFTNLTLGLIFSALVIGGVFYAYSLDLPTTDSLAQYAPETISRVYDSEGKVIAEYAAEHRIYTPISEIPPIVKQAFISAEDKHFYHHHGYDVQGMLSALLTAIETRGHVTRGASTITQQVVKNLELSSERSIERKVKEIILATRLEAALTKDKILEIYLNEIFLGHNSFGVAAAARTYFNKTLDQLTVAEAATLASMPKAPSNSDPVKNRDYLLGRRAYVLGQMKDNGYIDAATYKKAMAEPMKSVQGGDFPAYRESLPPRGYFTAAVRQQLSGTFGQNEFDAGGLTVRATVVPELQDMAAKALQDGLEKYDRDKGVWRGTGRVLPAKDLKGEAWRPALAALEHLPRDVQDWHVAVVLSLSAKHARVGIEGVDKNGGIADIPVSDMTWARKDLGNGKLGRHVRVPHDLLDVGDVVMVKPLTDAKGNFTHWSLRQTPQAEGALMAMDVNTGRVMALQGGFSFDVSEFNRATQATRQPGSAFKPFVFAAALDSGYTPATLVLDAPISVDTPQGLWTPKNAEKGDYGPKPMRYGLVHSRNLMTIRIAQDIGMDKVASYADRFGAYDHLQPYLANAIGSQGTTLYRMVSSYAMFANGGERVEPTLVDRVQDRYGRTIYRHDQRTCVDCKQESLPQGQGPDIVSHRERVLNAITAYELTSMMEGVVQHGTAAGVVNLPVPVAGKTGTTDNAKSVWFIGFTSNIVAGCYMGFDTPRSLGKGAFGGSLCAPIFQDFMSQVVKKYGGGPFKVPPGGYFINIDRNTGARLPDTATGDNVVAEYFRDGEVPVFGVDGMVTGGFAMGAQLPQTLPTDGTQTDTGRTVTTSKGDKVIVPNNKPSFGAVSSGGLY